MRPFEQNAVAAVTMAMAMAVAEAVAEFVVAVN